MELTNEFRVDADPATTWAVLTDLERIAVELVCHGEAMVVAQPKTLPSSD